MVYLVHATVLVVSYTPYGGVHVNGWAQDCCTGSLVHTLRWGACERLGTRLLYW